jgi:hypothetical protein
MWLIILILKQIVLKCGGWHFFTIVILSFNITQIKAGSHDKINSLRNLRVYLYKNESNPIWLHDSCWSLSFL